MDRRRILSAGNWAEHCGTLCGSTSDMKDYLIDARGPQSSSPHAGPERRGGSTNSCSRDDISGRLSTYRMGVSGKFTSHPIGILSTIAIQLFAVRKDWAVGFPFRPYTRRSLRTLISFAPHATERIAPKANPSQAQYLAQARSVEADALTHAHGMT